MTPRDGSEIEVWIRDLVERAVRRLFDRPDTGFGIVTPVYVEASRVGADWLLTLTYFIGDTSRLTGHVLHLIADGEVVTDGFDWRGWSNPDGIVDDLLLGAEEHGADGGRPSILGWSDRFRSPVIWWGSPIELMMAVCDRQAGKVNQLGLEEFRASVVVRLEDELLDGSKITVERLRSGWMSVPAKSREGVRKFPEIGVRLPPGQVEGGQVVERLLQYLDPAKKE